MAGAAVHVSSMIGATPYYVSKERDGSESKPFTFPSMSIMSLISKFNHAPMSELLEKPTGKVDDLTKGGGLVLELASRFASDALAESYFGWDPAIAPTRGDHNLIRAQHQVALFRIIEKNRTFMVDLTQELAQSPLSLT